MLKARMFSYTVIIVLTMVINLISGSAWCQQAGSLVTLPDGAVPIFSVTPNVSTCVSCKPALPITKIYLVDQSKHLVTYNVVEKTAAIVGTMSVLLTDISFTPDGKLYGIDSSNLYQINPLTATAIRIGSHGVFGLNALFCDGSSKCFGFSFASPRLYKINTKSGLATSLGTGGSYLSAGDLVKVNGSLYLSSITQQIVRISPINGSVIGVVNHNITDLYGLAATSGTNLLGFSGTKVYKINPINGSNVFIKDLAVFGIKAIYGAAFKGYYQ